MSQETYTRDEFIHTAVTRGYGYEGQVSAWVKAYPKDSYTEEDLLECHRACSRSESKNKGLFQNFYCHITPEDATMHGLPARRRAYLYHPDRLYGKDEKKK